MAINLTKFQLYIWKGFNRQGMQMKGVLPAESIKLAEAQLQGQSIEIQLLKRRAALLAMGQ